MYYKTNLAVAHGEKQVEALVYIDPVCERGQPEPDYMESILRGAQHFGLPPEYTESLARDWSAA